MPVQHSLLTFPNNTVRDAQRVALAAAAEIAFTGVKTGGGANHILPGVSLHSSGTRTLVPNRIYYGYIEVRTATPISELVCEVQTPGAAGTVLRMALYDVTIGNAGARTIQTALMPCDVAGEIDAEAVVTLLPGAYMTAMISNGAPIMRTVRGAPPGMALGGLFSATPFVSSYYVPGSGTNLPDPGTPWTLAIASGSPLDQMVVLNTDPSPTPPVTVGPANPLTNVSGTGAREPLVTGNDYNLSLRGFSTEILANRVHTYGPYWAEEGGTIQDNVLRVHLVPKGTAQTLRAVLYADDGLANKFDTSTVAISRPTTAIAAGTEVTIAANAAAGWYDFPISATITKDGFYWPGVWSGTVAVGSEVHVSSAGGVTGHHRARSTSGTATYASTGLPPTLTVGITTLTVRQEGSIYFSIKATAVAAPTLSLVANTDASISLTITSTDARTSDYQIERSADAGTTYINLGVIDYSEVALFRDPDLVVSQSYMYRVGARYRTSSPATVTATAVAMGTRRAYVHFSPAATAASVTVPNPMRGMVDTNDTTGVWPTGTTVFEFFSRGWNWKDIQPTGPTTFNYDYGDQWTTEAANRGQRSWLRWRAYTSFFTGSEAPQWLIDAGLTSNGIPLWNNEQVILYILEIFTKFGIRYNNDNRVAAIDIGAIYNFGEWSEGDAGGAISVANAKRIIARACQTFSNKIVVVNLPDLLLDAAIRESLPLFSNLHVRQDGIGGDFSAGAAEDVYWSRVTGGNRCEDTRAKLRYSGRVNSLGRAVGKYCEPYGGHGDATPDPAGYLLMKNAVVNLRMSSLADTNFSAYETYSATAKQALLDAVRLCGYRYRTTQVSYPSSFVNGQSASVMAWWANDGTAPTMEAWRPQWQLRTGTTLIASATSGLYLREISSTEGSPRLQQDNITFTGVTAGTYKLCLQVPRLNTSMPHMRLAHSAETTGQYTEIGDVVVV